MNNAKKLLVVWLATGIFLSGCLNRPEAEICVLGDAGCICHDPRLPKEQQDYTRTFKECINYIATNPDDYQAGEEWVLRHCK
jgi:hypothetical protein